MIPRRPLPKSKKPIPFSTPEDMWRGYPGAPSSKREKVKSALRKHTPGGQDHPQERHGAWATGTSGDRLASDLFTDGGFTVEVKTGDRPQEGMSVALTPHNENFAVTDLSSSADLSNRIRAYTQRNYAYLTAPGAHLGGWLDHDTGRIHLDVVMVAPDLDAALAIAGVSEKAVYNLATGETIPNPNYDGRYD
jgi:hypothetical protein